MLITSALANEIVTRAMGIIHHNVNVIDHRGMIVASGDRLRIGQMHSVAQEVIRTGKRISVCSEVEASHYAHVQPGINHPIIADDQVVMVIGVSGDPAVISRYAELAILTAELLVRQALENRDVNWNQRLRDTLLVKFLDEGDSATGRDALQRLSALGFHLERPVIPVVVDIARQHSGDILGGLLRDFTQLPGMCDVVLSGSHEILLLGSVKCEPGQLIESIGFTLSNHISHYHIGVGVIAHHAKGCREAIQFARAVIEVGQRVQPQQQIYHFRDMAMFCLFSVLENSYMFNFFNNNVQLLVAHDSGDVLLETLEGFISNNGEQGKTAKQLGIHRNTLSYRLSLVKKILQLDPLSFQDLVQISVSIHCYRRDNPLPGAWIDSVD